MGESKMHAVKALALYIMLVPFATNLFCLYSIKGVIGPYKIEKERSQTER